jgi:Transposase DDE domain
MKNIIIEMRHRANKVRKHPKNKLPGNLGLNLIQDGENTFLFYYNRLLVTFPTDDLFSRNVAILNLYINQNIKQKILSKVFGLSGVRIRAIFKMYRDLGMAGLAGPDPSRFSNSTPDQSPVALESENKSREEGASSTQLEAIGKDIVSAKPNFENLNFCRIEKEYAETLWKTTQYAGAFLLFGFLKKMNIFEKMFGVAGAEVNQESLIQMVLTLFFMNALRFKNIEQSKFLDDMSFSYLIQGQFKKLQHLRYAIDNMTESAFFPIFVQEFFGVMIDESLKQAEKLFYVDGHFSPYYGGRKIPFGYDTKRQRGFPGRSNVFIHNITGKNVFFFESPTNNALHQDLPEVMTRLKSKLGDLFGVSFFFDRGGFSSDTFKQITQEGAYFTTFLKNRKKEASIDKSQFIEVEIEVNHEKRKIKIYEKERTTRSYGDVRIITFIGREGQQIPILTTEPTRSAAEIVERMKGRWKEENCFKFMVDHYSFDLMSTYKMIQSPEKLIERPNPERTALNQEINEKKKELGKLHRELSEKVYQSKNKTTTTLTQLRKNNPLLYARIETLELQLFSLERIRKATITTTQVNLADEYYISDQKRRLLINLIKSLNYNCEKSLQELLQVFHKKTDETLAIIIQLIQQPGKIKINKGRIEIEINRLPIGSHARSCDQLIHELSRQHLLVTPFGTEIEMRQAKKTILAA